MAAQALQVRRVLCATDFSHFSADALRYAASICRTQGGELSVVHVHPRELPMAAEFAYLSPAPLDLPERAGLESRLEAFAEPARALGVRTRCRVLEGRPSREIAQLAEELEADLVVVGFRSDARLEHFLAGSVTEELLRSAPCPVLTVRHGVGGPPDAGVPFRRVLCAADLIEPGAETVSYAVKLAEAFHAELTLLHALEQVPEFEPGALVEIQALRQALAEEARGLLRAAVPEADRKQLAVRDLVRAGSAHERILDVAREERSQLIVLGARSHRSLGRLLFGSTSRRVLRDAPCPVLVVPETTAADARSEERASREPVRV